MSSFDERRFRQLASHAGLEYVALDTLTVEDDPVRPEAAASIPAELARMLDAVPFELAGDRLRVAVCDPDTGVAEDAIRAFAGKQPEFALASPAQIRRALERVYGPRRALRAERFEAPPDDSISHDDLRALAAEHGLAYVTLASVDLDVDAAAARLVGEQLSRGAALIGIADEQGTMFVAAGRILDATTLDVVRAVTGRNIVQVVAPPARVADALEWVFATHHPADRDRPAPPHRRWNGRGLPGRRVLEPVEPLQPVPPATGAIELPRPPELGIDTLRLRLLAVAGIGGLIWGLFALQDWLWSNGREPTSDVGRIISWAGYSWAVPTFPALVALAGLLLYRKPLYARRRLEPVPNVVSFRIVARGQNSFTLRRTIESVRREMRRLPLFPYVVEVVTDLPVDLGGGADLAHYVVPPTYRTPRGALYKARALEYAVEQSPLSDDAWVMHLDEESHVTPSLIVGIREAIEEEEASGAHRIGQGTILYHRDLAGRTLLTLADSVRTGDDLGRFHLQHRLGLTIFGLHGSFILVRNSVEREVGFDFGPEGSITEDSFWALRQMQQGRQCRWIDGYVAEQTPRTLMDFVRQRRRWFVGLVKVSVDAPVALRWRLGLAFSTAVWSLSWIGILYLYVNLFTGYRVPFVIHAAGNFAFAVYIMTYVLGLKLNLDNLAPVGRLRATLLYVAQVVLIPLFALFEALGVVYALVRPEFGFHVIRK